MIDTYMSYTDSNKGKIFTSESTGNTFKGCVNPLRVQIDKPSSNRGRQRIWATAEPRIYDTILVPLEHKWIAFINISNFVVADKVQLIRSKQNIPIQVFNITFS